MARVVLIKVVLSFFPIFQLSILLGLNVVKEKIAKDIQKFLWEGENPPLKKFIWSVGIKIGIQNLIEDLEPRTPPS